jgi:hypothetical protein
MTDCSQDSPGSMRERLMTYTKPMILPLDLEGKIYALQDEKGNTIGTGTREVCEVLMFIITQAPTRANSSGNTRAHVARRPNVRAAIAI